MAKGIPNRRAALIVAGFALAFWASFLAISVMLMLGEFSLDRSVRIKLHAQQQIEAGQLCVDWQVNGRSLSARVPAISAGKSVRMTIDASGEGVGVVVRSCAPNSTTVIFSAYLEATRGRAYLINAPVGRTDAGYGLRT